ncbi:MAG: Crp/Fnr family transcriptional regulator [Acetatifactor sp.]
MAGITLEKGKQIYKAGQPMTALHLITKGKIQAEYPGGSYQLGKGDVVGICEICSEVHFLGYTTLEESVILTYPVNNMDALDDLLQKHPDVARLFLLSLFRQITTLLEQSSISEMKCASLHQNLLEDYQNYNALCTRYRIQPRILDGLDDAAAYLGDESPDIWLNTYYMGLQHLYSVEISKYLVQEPGVSLGMLRKGSLDFRKTYTVLDEQYHYRAQVADFYFNQTGNDLFDLYTSLYYRLGQNGEDAKALYTDISRMIRDFEKDSSLTAEQFSARVSSFQSNMERISTPEKAESREQDAAGKAILSELAGSMNTILEYAGCDPDTGAEIRQHVNAYKALEDKNSTDDSVNKLRRQLTEEFYTLYPILFERAVDTPYIPIPVRMFLYFGYLDEELAGAENCVILYNLVCGMQDTGKFGVYTFFDWLSAIFNGEKNPSRNEFDEDYVDYIHKQKASGNISASEAEAMERDPMSRVTYELRNMFPSVNKITYGRITTFCPLFTADNVLKDLNASYVDVSKISKALEMIRSIDYSAFYRESLDYENIDVMGKETIHLECLPDVILMPNVGIRGVMWQEIEGKKRNTPGRMVFSIFHMEDINTTMVRLTGEFRWEMCKRIQGSRWNDVSERSLTSEYFDYIQFYRKNHDLSADAKERIKNSLQKAKNSFKEMFVRDYVQWVLFEGNGSPRLNRVARKIMFTYCPFPASLNATLAQNPLFSELLDHQRIVTGQKLHHIDVLIQKFRNSGISVPETLTTERAFIEGKI